jgi:hypothetical protein
VQPITVDSLFLAIGQRAEVVINANQTPGAYWFRAEVESACRDENKGVGMAIFTYSTAKKAGTPTSFSTYTDGNACIEPSPLVPWVVNTVGSVDAFLSQVQDLELNLLVPGVNTNTENIIVWSINQTAIDVQWETPTLSYVMAGDNSFPVTENLIELPNEGIWSYWIIQESQTAPNVAVAHPIQ